MTPAIPPAAQKRLAAVAVSRLGDGAELCPDVPERGKMPSMLLRIFPIHCVRDRLRWMAAHPFELLDSDVQERATLCSCSKSYQVKASIHPTSKRVRLTRNSGEGKGIHIVAITNLNRAHGSLRASGLSIPPAPREGYPQFVPPSNQTVISPAAIPMTHPAGKLLSEPIDVSNHVCRERESCQPVRSMFRSRL
jgi:hypothetical protein